MAKAKQFNWEPRDAGFTATMPHNVTLVVMPDHTTGLWGAKPKRGTTWHAQASEFDGKSTVSAFGRDEYNVRHANAKAAMRAAEAIYMDAMGMGPGTVGLYYFDADRRSYGPFPTEAARDWHKDHVTLTPREYGDQRDAG